MSSPHPVDVNSTGDESVADDTGNGTASPPGLPHPPVLTALFAAMAGLVILLTIVGNMTILKAYWLERRLQHPTNYFLVSLAVADLLIGVICMPMFTAYSLLGAWPLSRRLCDIWLCLDWTICLSSQYTVFLITLDRLLSVKNPVRYRIWRTPCKTRCMLSMAWIVPGTFLPAVIIVERYFSDKRSLKPWECDVQFFTDPLIAFVLTIFYYWLTLFALILFYAGIYRVAVELQRKADAKRLRLREVLELARSQHASPVRNILGSNVDGDLFVCDLLGTDLDSAFERWNDDSCASHSGSRIGNSRDCIPDKKASANTNNSSRSGIVDNKSPTTTNNRSGGIVDNGVPSTNANNSRGDIATKKSSTTVTIVQSDPTTNSSTVDPQPCMPSLVRRHSDRQSNLGSSHPSLIQSFCKRRWQRRESHYQVATENRARKALRTISFILGVFVACWTPYHVVVLVRSICSECVSVTVYQVTYWLCYLISPTNPFCYAYANTQFKRTCIKVLKCQCGSI